jgi:hypothetical protein
MVLCSRPVLQSGTLLRFKGVPALKALYPPYIMQWFGGSDVMAAGSSGGGVSSVLTIDRNEILPETGSNGPSPASYLALKQAFLA